MSKQEASDDLSSPRTLRQRAEEMIGATQSDVSRMSAHEIQALGRVDIRLWRFWLIG